MSDAPQPSSIETEYAIIAAILFDKRKVDAAADAVKSCDFADPFYGRIFETIVSQHAKQQPLNVMTLRPFIEADPGYEEVGGTRFLAELTQAAAQTINVRDGARLVAEFAKRRRLVAAMQEAMETALDVSRGLDEAAQFVDDAITGALDGHSSARDMTAGTAVNLRMKQAENPGRSITSGIVALDDLVGGMRPKQLVIGAGRPGMGKTATALSFTQGAARNGHGVLFISLEMGAEELASRMAADHSYSNGRTATYAEINAMRPPKNGFEAMEDARVAIDALPIYIMDAGSLTLGKLDMLVRRQKRRFAARGESLDLIVIDYLQLLRTDVRRNSNYETVSEISMRLKSIAKDHDVCVFALAQLSRGVESRTDKRPVLSDLRDSGQIEQDADAVIFFYRHAYYLRQEEPKRDTPEHETWAAALEDCIDAIKFIAPKVRNGPSGSAGGYFYGAYQAVRG